MEWLAYAAIAVVSWAMSMVTYFIILKVAFNQTVNQGDTIAILFWSGISIILAVPIVYLPVLGALKHIFKNAETLWVFPLVAACLGVAPTAIIGMFFGGGLSAIFSTEAVWFDVMFGVFGIFFGTGFALWWRIGTGEGDDA